MSQESQGINVYLEAIKALRSLIAKDYADGGWLPGGRKMAQELKIGHSTYRKALTFLEEEGLIKSYPQKGHYVFPDYTRCRKIGIIINDGKQSPFFQLPQYICEAFTVIHASEYSIQAIQAASINQLHEMASLSGIEGLIWFYPSKNASNEIEKIKTIGDIPLVTIQDSLFPSTLPGVITYDVQQINRTRAKYMLNRGHKSIAYIGNYDSNFGQAIKDELSEAGVSFSKENCIKDITTQAENLIPLLKKQNTTAIIIDAAVSGVSSLCEALTPLPAKQQPEIQIPITQGLKKLRQRFPKVKLIEMEQQKNYKMGQRAAEMLLEHLKTGKPLDVLKVGLAINAE